MPFTGELSYEDYVRAGNSPEAARAKVAADKAGAKEAAAREAAFQEAQKKAGPPPDEKTTKDAKSQTTGEQKEAQNESDTAGVNRNAPEKQEANNGQTAKKEAASTAGEEGDDTVSDTPEDVPNDGGSTTGPRNAMLRDVLFISEDNHLEIKTSTHYISNGMYQKDKVDENYSGPIEYDPKTQSIKCSTTPAGGDCGYATWTRNCGWFPGKMLWQKLGFKDEDPAEACMCVDNNKRVSYRDKDNNLVTVDGEVSTVDGGINVKSANGQVTNIPSNKQEGAQQDVKPTIQTVDITRKFPIHGKWYPAVLSPFYTFTPYGPPPVFDGDDSGDGDDPSGESPPPPVEEKVIIITRGGGDGEGGPEITTDDNPTAGVPVGGGGTNCNTSPKQVTVAVPNPAAGSKVPCPPTATGNIGGAMNVSGPTDQTPVGAGPAAGFFARWPKDGDSSGGGGGGGGGGAPAGGPAGGGGGKGASAAEVGLATAKTAEAEAQAAVNIARAAYLAAPLGEEGAAALSALLDAQEKLRAAKKAALDAGSSQGTATAAGGQATTGGQVAAVVSPSGAGVTTPAEPVDTRTDVERAREASEAADAAYTAAVNSQGAGSQTAATASAAKAAAARQLQLAEQREQWAVSRALDDEYDKTLKRIKELEDEIRLLKVRVAGETITVRDGHGGISAATIPSTGPSDMIEDRENQLILLRAKLAELARRKNKAMQEARSIAAKLNDGVAVKTKFNDKRQTAGQGQSSNGFNGVTQVIREIVAANKVYSSDIDVARIAFGEHGLYMQLLFMQKKNNDLAAEAAVSELIESFDEQGGWTCSTSLSVLTTSEAVEGTGLFRGRTA